jgi:hypothetical protein
VTTSEAIVLAAAVGAGSALLAAGVATFGTYRVTTRSIGAQASRDREARLAEVYFDMLWLVQTTMFRVELIRPMLHFTSQGDPPRIAPGEEPRIKAKIQAVGSVPIRDKWQEWRTYINGFVVAVGQLDELAGGENRSRPHDVPVEDWRPLSDAMNQSRDLARSRAADLERLVRAELTDQQR